MAIEFQRTTPIFRIFHLEKAIEFYVDFLGFKIDWEHRLEAGLPLYMQISRGDLVLHLSEHHGDATPSSTIFVVMSGLKEFHEELSAKNYNYNRPEIERMPWNADVMQVIDPFANRIRFNQYGPSQIPTKKKAPTHLAKTGSRRRA